MQKTVGNSYDESCHLQVGGTRNFESRVGRPENRIVGLEAIDLVRTQAQLDALKNQGFKTYGRDPYLGMILYKDIRGANYSDTPDGKIDDNDMMLLSEDNTPRINYGFGLNASWRGLLSPLLLQGVMDNDRVIAIRKGGRYTSAWRWDFAVAFKAKVLLYKRRSSICYRLDNAIGPMHMWRIKLLMTAKSEKGPEVYFAVINAYPNKVAAWDNGVRPGSESRGAAGAVPSWDFVKAFPMKDGRLFSDPAGKYYKSDAAFLQSYWENRDPRFDKSIVWNGKLYEVSGKARQPAI
ncbi:hypothetical protein FQR65_LT14725 [Abscondita terminalis]|nr:hypothetical protein FQR65_LT14725 [Abscondita terminalis]